MGGGRGGEEGGGEGGKRGGRGGEEGDHRTSQKCFSSMLKSQYIQYIQYIQMALKCDSNSLNLCVRIKEKGKEKEGKTPARKVQTVF